MWPELLIKLAKQKNISVTFVSRGWVAILRRGEKTRFIVGYKFDLNRHGAGLVIDDKFATYEVLKAAHLPVLAHQIHYAPTNREPYAVGRRELADTLRFFQRYGSNIVIKPNNGTLGQGVVHVTNIQQLQEALQRLTERHFSLSLTPYVECIHEHRVVIFRGEPRLHYTKCLPRVTGDGTRTLGQLVAEFNPGYYTPDRINRPELERIPARGEICTVGWQFNLSRGAIARPTADVLLLGRLDALAQAAAAAAGLEFGSVDIMETRAGDLVILELNSGVMLENFTRLNPDFAPVVEALYAEALDALFLQ